MACSISGEWKRPSPTWCEFSPPSLSGKGAGGSGAAVRAAAFVLLLAYWTYLLLKPSPFPDRYIPEFSWFDKDLLKFLLAKCLHLGVYAFFAVLGGSLVPAGRWRILILTGLVLHGAATEVGQWVGGTYF